MSEHQKTSSGRGVAAADLLQGGFGSSLAPIDEHPNLGVDPQAAEWMSKREPKTAPTPPPGNEPEDTHALDDLLSSDEPNPGDSTPNEASQQQVDGQAPKTHARSSQEVDTLDTQFSVLNSSPEALAERLRRVEPIKPTQWHRRLLRRPADAQTLHRHELEEQMRAMLPRPITMVTVQTKGSAGKTPTVIGLASALGSARGGDTIAVDNDETQGLTDRVETSHNRNLGNLLAHLDWFLEDPAANCLALDWLCQRQLAGFKVLGGDHPRASRGQAISGVEFSKMHHVVTKYNPIAVVDTGNAETAPNWRAAVRLADILIVPIRMREDYLMPAARMLHGLREQGHDLTNRVIIVVSNGDLPTSPEATALAREYFSAFPQVEIPFDPVINGDGPIRWDRLRDTTRTAYQELGAKALDMAITNASAQALTPNE